MNNTQEKYFDKFGVEIKEFSLLKVYHFFGRTIRNGKGYNYMYKQVAKKEINGKYFLVGYHLPIKDFNNPSYFRLGVYKKNEEGRFGEVEVVSELE